MLSSSEERSVAIPVAGVTLAGDLAIPSHTLGLVLFAHGGGSSRRSPRNRFVAECLQREGFATLLTDLLTEQEDRVYATRFDIDLLTRRLTGVTAWLQGFPPVAGLAIGYFGASTGAASALRAAAELGDQVRAVVSRGGRPDLAVGDLGRVRAPTLLIVGGRDLSVIELNRQAYALLRSARKLEIVPGATHLFEEPGALEAVANLAAAWFAKYLPLPEAVPAGTTTAGEAADRPHPS